MLDTELQTLFKHMLNRAPDPFERLIYLPHTSEHVENVLRYEREYMLIQDPEGKTERCVYDDVSGFVMENPNPNKYIPVIIGNGKVYAYTSPQEEGMSSAGITHKFDFDTINTYDNNVHSIWDLFNNRFQLAGASSSSSVRTHPVQHLNMPEGYFRSSYHCRSFYEEGASLFVGGLNVEKTVRALRQYPYTFHNRHLLRSNNTMLPDPPSGLRRWSMRHEVVSLPNATGSLYTLVNISGVWMLNCECTVEGTLMCACVVYKSYLRGDDGSEERLDPTIRLIKETELGGVVEMIFTLPEDANVLVESFATVMTSNDFPRPDAECKRISLAVCVDPGVVAKHAQLWNGLWKGRMKIEAAPGITETEDECLTKHNAYIKNSLYTLYSKIRDDVNPDANPLNLSVIDDDGKIFWEGEMCVVPVLLVFNPKLAKVLLNFRYNQLENAKNVALAYGRKGAKFPYQGDVANYTDTYWSSTSPLYVHNTALVGINTWNYYRLSKDIDWMFTKGYKILKNTTRFLLDMLEIEYGSRGEIIDIYIHSETLDMNGKTHSPTNTFLMYMIFLNLKYTLEATYELNYTANYTNWYAVYNAMARMYRVENRSDVVTKGINPVFDQEVQFQFDFRDPTGGVDVYTNNGELHLWGEDTYMGFAFGGDTGRTILIDPSKDYTFRVHGQPLGLYQEDGNEAHPSSGTNIAGYYHDQGVFLGSQLRSFKGKYTRPFFGTAAFDHFEKVRSHKVVKIDTDSGVGEKTGKREEYLMMQHFYSRELFNLVVETNERVQVIKNTLDYFMRREDNDFNRLNEAGLYGYIAQKTQTSESRRTCARMFDQIMLRHIDQKTRFGWGVESSSSMGLFGYVGGLFGSHPRGAINQVRYSIESFGMGVDNSSVLPGYWKTFTMGTHTHKSHVMRNIYSS